MTPGAMAKLPLAGLRVLDLATMMAAPWAATFLADYGAEVIKVEHPVTGDPARHFGKKAKGQGVFWKTLARNKRCLTVNLKDPAGQDVVRRLVCKYDVVIENFRPGVLKGWGLDYERLAAINQRVIMLSVTGFGQDGPYAKRAGFGTIAEAMSGFAYANGHPDNPPTLPSFPLADGVAGVSGAFCVLIAVYERDVLGSGKGQHIDISLYEPLARLMEEHAIEYSALGEVRERSGNRSESSAPRNVYKTADNRWVALSASTQAVFERVIQVVGRSELINDPRFEENSIRVKHAAVLDEVVGAWIQQHSQEEVVRQLSESGAAIGPVYSVAELLDDPQVLARGSYERYHDPEIGKLTVAAPVAKFSRTPGQVRHLGQKKGEETESILLEHGFTTAEIQALRRRGVI